MVTKKDIFIIFVLLGIGIVRYFFFIPKPPSWNSFVGKSIKVEGIVKDPPDVRLNSQRITLAPQGQATNILLVLPLDTDIAYGDKIQATGVLETPQNFLTTAGKEFNYERYLANQDIYFIIRNPNIRILSHKNGNPIAAYLFRFADSFMKNIAAIISPPESDLANGLILGARGGFDETMRTEFIATGTIHIVALSGYNVTIVATQLMKILSLFLSQSVAICCGIVTIFLFIIMAGASSTAIRAGIMATLALLAKLYGRKYDAGRALVIAALLMIAYDPRVITDISFQLSFLATFGVLFVTPKVLPWIFFLPLRFGIRETAATTIAATITVLPLLLYSTGILSLVSLPANMLILSLIPFTMFMSFLVGICGYISHPLSFVFGYGAHVLLRYILIVIHLFASIPHSSVTLGMFPVFLTTILYGLLVLWLWKTD